MQSCTVHFFASKTVVNSTYYSYMRHEITTISVEHFPVTNSARMTKGVSIHLNFHEMRHSIFVNPPLYIYYGIPGVLLLVNKHQYRVHPLSKCRIRIFTHMQTLIST